MKSDNPDENVDRNLAGVERPRNLSRDRLADLENRIDRLTARNERLHDHVGWIDRSGAIPSTLGFVGLSVLSAVGAFVVPSAQSVLLAIAGIGITGVVLSNAVARGEFIERGDAEEVYAACAANYDAMIATFDHAEDRLYLPGDDGRIRLFVPRRSDEFPESGDALVAGDADRQGLVLEPIGNGFVREVEGAVADAMLATPAAMVEQLTDALEDRFEFVAATDSIVEAGRAEVAVSGSAFGPVDRFDHPVASILAVGLATHLERPVRLEVTDETDRGEWLVSCHWEPNTDQE
ncbi:hypothetical protein HYG81_01740 [Natrinema zhouii]|uniref:DUF7982 domain-containing protein n=1 Tax=Natrinema zhouii TaxID=1710539 RepID=A0A7D6H3B3_9EURY|nr:hypothetical protein [Natrinema zhouii]QLK26367.1 hypothetical protein HYG81_01740 [Natrinema zhouii]